MGRCRYQADRPWDVGGYLGRVWRTQIGVELTTHISDFYYHCGKILLVATEDGGHKDCVSRFVEIIIGGVVHWAILAAWHIAEVLYGRF